MAQAGEDTQESCCLPLGHMAWVSRRKKKPAHCLGQAEDTQRPASHMACPQEEPLGYVDSREMGKKEAEQLKHHEERWK